jgi:diguanylate cyclase (GGDEF)-like protein
MDFTATNLLHVPPIAGIVANIKDTTEHRALEEELKRQAFYDSLTGLANRALIRDRAGQALRRSARTGASTALIIFDVDDFKDVNDHHGHLVGDGLLTELGRRFSSVLRATDSLARLGGDEFAVLVEELDDPDMAARVAERLLASLEEPLTIAGTDRLVTVSLGVVVDVGDRTVEDLFRDADLAMYEAKRAGKATYRLFAPDMHTRLVRTLRMRADLEGALKRGQLEIFYQPQIDLGTRAITGVEALLRWRHPEWGLVSPLEFIPIAEASAAIVEIGSWVLHEATRQAVEWQERLGTGLVVSVNVSPRQLGEELVTEVEQALAASGLDPNNLVLELTERVFLERDKEVLAVLDRLTATGARLSIDDFGTGYSSLGYLKDLPISELKIDRGFVAHVADDIEDRALAHAIIRVAEALKLGVVAEGIEREEQASALSALGCSSAQGFLFARPMPAPEVERMLVEARTTHALGEADMMALG